MNIEHRGKNYNSGDRVIITKTDRSTSYSHGPNYYLGQILTIDKSWHVRINFPGFSDKDCCTFKEFPNVDWGTYEDHFELYDDEPED